MLGVFYAFECMAWVRPTDVMFSGSRLGAYRRSQGPWVFTGLGGGITLGGLFPPLATLVAADTAQTSVAVAEIDERARAFESNAAQLRMLCNVTFVYAFVVVPATVWWRGLPSSWLPLFLGLLALMWLVGLEFYRRFRRLYPEAPWLEHVVGICCWPPTAIRAVDRLARPLCEHHAPLAVAHVLCDKEEFLKIARREYFGGDKQALARSLVDRIGVVDELMTPPQPEDETCSCYCPRCHMQYQHDIGNCVDCCDIAVLALPPV